MKPTILALLLLLFSLATASATVYTPGSNAPPVVSFAWTSVTNVGAYRLYYGGQSGVYTNQTVVLGTNFVTVSLSARGVPFYFVATSIATNGLESIPSNEVTYAAPTPLPSPTLQQPVIVTVQVKTSLEDFMWADLGGFSLEPSQTFAAFRLDIAIGAQPIAPSLKRIAPELPPMPGNITERK